MKHYAKSKCYEPCYLAFQILRITFTLLPIIAGLDKFFNLLTDWSMYLAGPFNVFGNAGATMMVVGIIEIIAGILVFFMPKIFSYIVALWLLAIVVNLLIMGQFYDIVLRDLALLLSAVSLGLLSCKCTCCKSCCK